MTSIHKLTLTSIMYKTACVYVLFFLIIIPWDVKHHSFFWIYYLHTLESCTLHLENCVFDLCNQSYLPILYFIQASFHSELSRLFTHGLLLFLPGVKGSLSAHLLGWITHMLFPSIFPLWSLLLGTFTEHPLLVSSSESSIILCLFFVKSYKENFRMQIPCIIQFQIIA